MLGCMDIEKGYTSCIYQSCGEIIYIPHSCKSRICSTCGKRHADEWAEMINSEMYAVPYRQDNRMKIYNYISKIMSCLNFHNFTYIFIRFAIYRKSF